MRAIEFITEARRNPEQNPKVSPYERVVARAQTAPNNTFVSLTAINKLGINPGSKYNTPVGIYSYPAEYVIRTAPGTMKDLPFAGDQPFVNVFNAQGNIVNVSNMTAAEYQAWANKASDIFANLYKKRTGPETPEEKWKFGADIADKIVQNAPYKAKFGTSGGKFWYITMAFADWIVHQKLLNTSSVPVAWNSLFRLLGIDGCVDNGDGIIHTAERNQAVFFHSGAITNVERVDNKWDAYSRELGKDSMIEGIAKSAIVKWVRANPTYTPKFLYEYLTRFSNEDKPVMDALANYLESVLGPEFATLNYDPDIKQVVLPEALREMGNNGVWKLISTVKGLSNDTKFNLIQTWEAYSQGSSDVDLLQNEFRTPDFIEYLKNKIRRNPKDQKTNSQLLRIMATERVLTEDFFLELLDLDISETTAEHIAQYIKWSLDVTQDRVVPAALDGQRWALAAIRNNTILTEENLVDLITSKNPRVFSAVTRRYDPVLNQISNMLVVLRQQEHEGDEWAIGKARNSFRKLPLSAQERGLKLLTMMAQKDPEFELLLDIGKEVYDESKRIFSRAV